MSGREDPFRGGVAVYGAPPPSAIREWPEQPQPFVITPHVRLPVSPPPARPEADAETAAIEALARLDDRARQRVLRYCESRWGKS
jgi:hypothetical protein